MGLIIRTTHYIGRRSFLPTIFTYQQLEQKSERMKFVIFSSVFPPYYRVSINLVRQPWQGSFANIPMPSLCFVSVLERSFLAAQDAGQLTPVLIFKPPDSERLSCRVDQSSRSLPYTCWSYTHPTVQFSMSLLMIAVLSRQWQSPLKHTHILSPAF